MLPCLSSSSLKTSVKYFKLFLLREVTTHRRSVDETQNVLDVFPRGTWFSLKIKKADRNYKVVLHAMILSLLFVIIWESSLKTHVMRPNRLITFIIGFHFIV